MINNYKTFLLNEGISMSNEDIVEIIKHLEDNEQKNATLIKKLVNHENKNGKTILMNVVQSNNEDLIDTILKYVDDIHKVTKDTGENVLHFCKSIKIFNKFYNLGVDANIITGINRNMLIHLSTKRLYDVELYQKLIDEGEDINLSDANNYSVLSESFLNKKIVKLLIENNIELNDKFKQNQIIHYFFYYYRYHINKRTSLINNLILLLDNGMIIKDIDNFIENLKQLNNDNSYSTIFDLLEKIKKYIVDDNFLIKMYDRFVGFGHTYEGMVIFVTAAFKLDIYQNFYLYVKKNFGIRFNEYFEDFIKEHPYLDDSVKFNI